MFWAGSGSCMCDGACRRARHLTMTTDHGPARAMAPMSRPITVSRGSPPRSAEGGQGRVEPPVKLKHLALATLVPGAVAGMTVSAVALAAPTSPPAHAAKPAVQKSDQWVTVTRGQTLQSVARAHHISWDALVGTPPNTRHLRYPYHLVPGEHLRIPADPKLRAEAYRAERARIKAAAEAKAAALAKERAAAAAAAAAKQRAAAAQASQPVTAGMSSFE